MACPGDTGSPVQPREACVSFNPEEVGNQRLGSSGLGTGLLVSLFFFSASSVYFSRGVPFALPSRPHPEDKAGDGMGGAGGGERKAGRGRTGRGKSGEGSPAFEKHRAGDGQARQGKRRANANVRERSRGNEVAVTPWSTTLSACLAEDYACACVRGMYAGNAPVAFAS